MPTRKYLNPAVQTFLTVGVNSSATTLTVDDTTGWPSPGAGEEAVGALDYGNQAKVELFSYTGKTATSFTGVTRGVDGTTAQAHTPGAVVRHVASAVDIETGANALSATLTNAKGDLLVATAADTVTRKGVGADGTFLKADSAQPDGLVWDANPILKTIVDQKGDILAATAADTVARVAVGSDGKYLKADSSAGAGVSWDTLPAAASTTQGSYTGNATDPRTIALLFTPKFVIVTTTGVGMWATSPVNTGDTAARGNAGSISIVTNVNNIPQLTTNGFIVRGSGGGELNISGTTYHYFAIG